MELTYLALVIATVVILVLLMCCYGDTKSTTGYSHRQRISNNQSGSEYDDLDTKGPPSSTWGSGVTNTQLASQYRDLENLEGYEDYNSVAQYQSLEPEVYESHDQYANDLGIANRGASALPIRSDSNDLQTWVGLRRPDYQTIYAAQDARVQHSESPDQMPVRRTTGLLG
jgi:hypothetical protein